MKSLSSRDKFSQDSNEQDKVERFLRSKEATLSADRIPLYMTPAFTTGVKLPSDLKMIDATAVKSDRTFTLILSRHYEDEQLEEHIQTYINKTPALQFPAEEILIRDPTDCATGEEWRDILRRSLHFEDLKVDFYEIRCEIVEPHQVIQPVLFSVNSQGASMDWPKLSEHLEKSQAKIVRIRYLLMVLDEDDKVDREYVGVPSNISSFVMLDTDGDV